MQREDGSTDRKALVGSRAQGREKKGARQKGWPPRRARAARSESLRKNLRDSQTLLKRNDIYDQEVLFCLNLRLNMMKQIIE